MAPKRVRTLAVPSSSKTTVKKKTERCLKPGVPTTKTWKGKAPVQRKGAHNLAACTVANRLLKASPGVTGPTLDSQSLGSLALVEQDANSSSSDSSSEVMLTKKRVRNLHSRGRQRRRKYVDLLMEGKDPQSLSVLERRAVGLTTEKMYEKEHTTFMTFAKKSGHLDITNSSQVDQLLVDYMNRCFFEGHQAFVGDRLIASWLHHHPEYSRTGVKRIPRALRALRGWRRLCPGRSRTPYPLAVWCGLSVLMLERGFPKMAIFLMMSLSTYARPAELLRLRVMSLIRPATGVTSSWSILMSPEELGQPSKTGEYDISLLLDSPYLSFWGAKVFNKLKTENQNNCLWDFNYSQYLAVFKKCAKQMGIELSPYHTRHSGASIDRSRNYRSQLDVQKRGQWKSTKSIARYEKAARLAKSWEQVPNKAKEYCLACEEAFDGIMAGRKKLPTSTILVGVGKGST